MRDELMFRRLLHLTAHPGMVHALADPRFAALMSNAALRRAAGGDAAPPAAEDLPAAVAAATELVLRLDELALPLLEEQVRSLLCTAVRRDTVPTVLAVTGWAGGRPSAARSVAAREGIAANSVWHRVQRARRSLPVRPWLPALDAAGALLAALAPVSVDEAATALRAAGITDRWYSPAAILDLAAELGYDWHLEMVATPSGVKVASSAAAAAIRRDADAVANSCQPLFAAMRRTRILRLAELTDAVRGRLSAEQVRTLVDASPQLRLLADGWVGSYDGRKPSQFDNVVDEVFAVAPQISVRKMNEGLARGMAMRSLRWPVPDVVLREYLAHCPGVDVVGDALCCSKPAALTVIRPAERDLVTAIRATPTRVLGRQELLAVHTAAGRSHRAGQVCIARSPVLERVGRGLYRVRGDVVGEGRGAAER